jgi:hypothetical protein
VCRLFRKHRIMSGKSLKFIIPNFSDLTTTLTDRR